MKKIVYNSTDIGVILNQHHIEWLLKNGHADFIDQYGLCFDDVREDPILIECIESVELEHADETNKAIATAYELFDKHLEFCKSVVDAAQKLDAQQTKIDNIYPNACAADLWVSLDSPNPDMKNVRNIEYRGPNIYSILLSDDMYADNAYVDASIRYLKTMAYGVRKKVYPFRLRNFIPTLRVTLLNFDNALRNCLATYVELREHLINNQLFFDGKIFGWLDDCKEGERAGLINLSFSRLCQSERLESHCKNVKIAKARHLTTIQYDDSRYIMKIRVDNGHESIRLIPVMSKAILATLIDNPDHSCFYSWVDECGLNRSPFYSQGGVEHLLSENDIHALWIYLRKIGEHPHSLGVLYINDDN